MIGVPILSFEGDFDIIQLGASKFPSCNTDDPRFFLHTHLSLPQVPRATPTISFEALFLVDSGATHNVLS